MSKQIAIISAGASAALLQAASSYVRHASGGSVSTTMATSAERQAVIVGPDTPIGVHTVITRVPASPSAAFAGVRTVLVRAVVPRAASGTVQPRDALDVFPAAGIDATAARSLAEASLRQSAALAVRHARALGAARVTLVVKPAAKHAALHALFRAVSEEAVGGAGLAADVLSTAAAANALLLHPEALGVVLLSDAPAAAQVEMAFAGAVGGACRTLHTCGGGAVSGGHSYKSVAAAVAQELRGMGMGAEAEKLEADAARNARGIAGAK